ncbi:GNAT family N-acetyltransferase [Sorangium sp. So ce429]
MVTRRAGADDLPGLTEVFVRCFNAPPLSDGWTMETAARKLREIHDTPGFLGVVAEEGGRVIGFALGNLEQWISCPHYFLREMCVEPERQGAGVGTCLLEALLRDLEPLGVQAVYLLTTRGTPAVEFYRKHGFEVHEGTLVLLKALDGPGA